MRTMAALVFPGFETLDYFGPIEMLGSPPEGIEIVTVAQGKDPVPSVHGQRIVDLQAVHVEDQVAVVGDETLA